MSSNAVQVQWYPMKSLAFGSISGTYAAIGTAFSEALRSVIVNNATNAGVTISFDGTNDHLYLQPGQAIVVDYSSNMANPSGLLEQIAFTKVYVKGSPGLGSVYVSGYFASRGFFSPLT